MQSQLSYKVPTVVQAHEQPQQHQPDDSRLRKLTLTINLNNGYQYITGIWIFNINKGVEAEPSEKLDNSATRSYKLAPGKYFIRVEINGLIEDTPIDLYEDRTFLIGGHQSGLPNLTAPQLYSAAMLSGEVSYGTSHEYYTEPAVLISNLDTLQKKHDSQLRSGLFLFLHFPSAESYKKVYRKKSYWQRFSLVNAQNEVISSFPDHAVSDTDGLFSDHFSNESGFIGFSAYLSPGLYFLSYKGINAREVPIYVYEGWYTQFFLTVAEQPLFGSIRIFLSKERKYNPSNYYHIFVDICVNKIQNGDYDIDAELLRNIAYGKYDSPMLGLLGAYIYLKSSETKDDELFKVIVDNLKNKILVNNEDAPDIWALNLLSYEHFKETLGEEKRTSIEGTPMLRIAYDTIKSAATKYRWLVREGSLNDLIAENQVFDSPYNTYTPIKKSYLKKIKKPTPLLKNKRPKKSSSLFYDPEQLASMEYIRHDAMGFDDEGKTSLKNALDSGETGDQYTPVLQYVTPKRVLIGKKTAPSKKERLDSLLNNPKKTGWIGCSIANELLKNEDATSDAIADRINVPINTVQRLRKLLKI